MKSTLAHYADLQVSGLVVTPASGLYSGDVVTVNWNDVNGGTATAGAFTDTVKAYRVNADNSLTLLTSASVANPSGLAAGATAAQTATLQLPDGPTSVGTIHFVVTTDDGNAVPEYDANGNPAYANNVATYDETATLFPYPDLAVSNVQRARPDHRRPRLRHRLLDRDQHRHRAGCVGNWVDQVIVTPNAALGVSGDVVLGDVRAQRRPGWPRTATRRARSFALPPGFTGHFHLFVKTDATNQVFENETPDDNTGELSGFFDVMPGPYADLVVSSVQVPAVGHSGQPLPVEWTVKNQGIGLTSDGSWVDQVFLATDPAGTNIINPNAPFLFTHFGLLAPGDSYDRVGQITVPDGLSGTVYAVVTTAVQNGPFEFIYGNNNTTVSAAVPVVLTPTPDLAVTSVVAPTAVQESDKIDVTWTVSNQGPARRTARGSTACTCSRSATRRGRWSSWASSPTTARSRPASRTRAPRPWSCPSRPSAFSRCW